ncbi:Transporter of the ATP-binding cassette (ABC) [Savitreella phatthalungensis]
MKGTRQRGELHQPPKLELVSRVSEVVCVWALFALHLSGSLLASERTPYIVYATFWIYVATLTTVKNIKILNPGWTSTIFFHIFYNVASIFPVAFFEFRSAFLRRVSQFHFVATALNFVLVSIVLLGVLTTRYNTQTYPRLSTRGIPATHEPLASLLSLASFSWVDPVIWRGYKSAHHMDSVWDLDEDNHAEAVLQAFTAARKASKLMYTLLWHFRGLLVLQGFWAIVYSIFTFAPTILLKLILEYLEAPDRTSKSTAWLYCIGLLVGQMFSTTGNGQALWIGRKICIKLRAIIIGEVYAKSLRRRDISVAGDAAETSDGQANQGQIINLMAIDAFKVAEICAYLHYLIASVPLELVIAVYLLWRVLGWSAAAGLVGMALLLPLNYWTSRQFGRIQEALMKTTDIRINRMNEVLNSVRIIKYFAWEDQFMRDVNENRRAELIQLRRRFITFSIASLSWTVSPVIITLFTFYAYTKLAGHELTASVAFTALSLFNVLRAPLDQLADMVTNVLQSKVSLDRVEKFLNEEETQKYHILKRETGIVRPEVGFTDATFSWAVARSDDESATSCGQSFQVRDLSIDFPVGTLSIVCGPTGSGKTSLLLALLGEMTLVKGSAFLPGARNREDSDVWPGSELIDCVAYCAQTAWLLNDTIKNNILFSTDYEESRYRAVLTACALDRDLQIMENGDETQIGEKGITLSGGQKQRVSLARALYSHARHLLLDDCLSAVDSHTAKWIFENALTGSLVEDRTRILVTHNTALTLPEAHHVVLLDNGRIKAQGTPFEMVEQGFIGQDDNALHSAMSTSNSRGVSVAPSRVESSAAVADIVKPSVVDKKVPVEDQVPSPNPKKLDAQEEARAQGSVGWHVYSSYIKALGGPAYYVSLALAYALQQALNIYQSYWIREWALNFQARGASSVHMPYSLASFGGVSRPGSIFFPMSPPGEELDRIRLQSTEGREQTIVRGSANLNFYLGVYALITLGYCTVVFLRALLSSFGSLRASKVMHEKLLKGVLRTRMRFFDATPLGRILNRFSKDLETIDQECAIVLSLFAQDSLAVIVVVFLISVITPGFLIAGAVITFLYTIVGVLYVRTSRELKRLDSVTRSPIYQHFGETLAGVTTIRAYGLCLGFIQQNLTKIDTNNRPFYYLWACNRWLSVRIDMGGALVAFFAAAFVILNVDRLDAGLAGISITYAITFTDHILWCVRFYALNEMNMNSVERVGEYLALEPEIAPEQAVVKPVGVWPSRGAIDVNGLSMSYAPELPTVLKNLSFKVEPGSKIGIVGRTGAGKSSIATAFFRLVEPQTGTICIDGVDISKLDLKDLRRGLTIIPQDPTLFQRSLRFNLDPFDEHSDLEIFEALRRVHLIDSPNAQGCVPARTRDTDTVRSRHNESNVTVGDSSASAKDDRVENANVFYNLETPVAEGGANLSQGQRQLLCLARALLRLPKIIFLDESTASVDYATDAKIQKTIRASFKDSTILTIAHRLRSICDYDKILVMDAGSAVEYDHPYHLMITEGSIFREMCQSSGEFNVLLEMAKDALECGPLLDVR